MPTILLVTAFPPTHTLNVALADAYRAGAQASGDVGGDVDVDTLDLTALQFETVLRQDSALEPDLVDAQRRLLAADHLTWVMPTYWARPPAVLSAFIDRTFLPGFAYKNTGKPLPEPLLKGRSSRIITTMDSPSWWYRFWHGRSLHRSLQRGTFHYVGLAPRWETTVYAVRQLSETQRQRAIDTARRAGVVDAMAIHARQRRREPALLAGGTT